MAEAVPQYSFIPSICVVRAWEKSDQDDTSVLTNGIAGVKTGWLGGNRHEIACLRCGMNFVFDAAELTFVNPDCPLDQPEDTAINLFESEQAAKK